MRKTTKVIIATGGGFSGVGGVLLAIYLDDAKRFLDDLLSRIFGIPKSMVGYNVVTAVIITFLVYTTLSGTYFLTEALLNWYIRRKHPIQEAPLIPLQADVEQDRRKIIPSESGFIYSKETFSDPLQGISSALASGHRGLLDAYKVFKTRIKDPNLMGVLGIESPLLSQLFTEMESIVEPIEEELREYEEYLQGHIYRNEESEGFQKERIVEKLDHIGRAFSLRREILQEISKVLEKYGSA